MKVPVPPSSALLFLLLGAFPASAQLIEVSPAKILSYGQKIDGQESTYHPSFASDKSLSGVYQLPIVHKASGEIVESSPIFISQDVRTLGARHTSARKVESVLDLSVLEEPSAYRNASLVKLKVSSAQASGIQEGLSKISAAYQKPGQATDSADCPSVAMSVEHRIKMDPSKVLEIVESEVSANNSCACEIVKTAIRASGADETLVADIAEVAIVSAPDSMRMISQCAIAALPEALSAVQAVIARLDPNSGDTSYSAKDSKSGKDAKESIVSEISPPAIPPNPLDLPPPIYPPLPPPPLIPPPQVTNPNPVP